MKNKIFALFAITILHFQSAIFSMNNVNITKKTTKNNQFQSINKFTVSDIKNFVKELPKLENNNTNKKSLKEVFSDSDSDCNSDLRARFGNADKYRDSSGDTRFSDCHEQDEDSSLVDLDFDLVPKADRQYTRKKNESPKKYMYTKKQAAQMGMRIYGYSPRPDLFRQEPTPEPKIEGDEDSEGFVVVSLNDNNTNK